MSDWRKAHDKLYGNSEDRENQRIKAAKLIRRLKRHGLRPCLHQGDLRLVATEPDVDPEDCISDHDQALLVNLKEVVEDIVKDERVDGHLGSRLVVFLEECSFYHTQSRKRYTFPFGCTRIMEADLARRMVALGAAEYHPGPRTP